MNKRTEIINTIIERYNFKTYLEIGVRNINDNFKHIQALYKDSVDPTPLQTATYKMTSDEFFNNYIKMKYDLIFVDGLHTAEQVYKDILNAIKYLTTNGFIVVHDCNPPSQYHTRSYNEYLKHRGPWNGDVYKGFLKIKKELTNWKCFVVDEDYGCGIITQSTHIYKESHIYDYDTDLSWENFNKNKHVLLDLITYTDFIKMIE